jgi:hypothetical protein
VAASLEEIARLNHEAKDAARLYVVEGSLTARVLRGHPVTKLEDGIRDRERMAFLQGICWERTRANDADWAALEHGASVFSQVVVPPGHKATHVGGRVLANVNAHQWLIPCMPGHEADWKVDKL